MTEKRVHPRSKAQETRERDTSVMPLLLDNAHFLLHVVFREDKRFIMLFIRILPVDGWLISIYVFMSLIVLLLMY